MAGPYRVTHGDYARDFATAQAAERACHDRMERGFDVRTRCQVWALRAEVHRPFGGLGRRRRRRRRR